MDGERSLELLCRSTPQGHMAILHSKASTFGNIKVLKDRRLGPLLHKTSQSTGIQNHRAVRGLYNDALSKFLGYSRSPNLSIKSVRAFPLNAPLKESFTIACSNISSVNNVAVRLTLSDGSFGWGECPVLPGVTVEDQDVIMSHLSRAGIQLQGSVVPSVCETLESFGSMLPGLSFASSRAGVEMAFLDAMAKSAQRPLWQLFGGASSEAITDITVPICELGQAAALSRRYSEAGFSCIKTKVGSDDLVEDVKRIQAIRDAHPTCEIIVDANGGYTPAEAITFLKELDGLGIRPTLFEQPVSHHDWSGLGYVSRVSLSDFGVHVAADESCRSLEDARRIVEAGQAHVLNLKLAKLGVLTALQLLMAWEEEGWGRGMYGLMLGGMVETRTAMGFAAHLAAGTGAFRFVDLDTPLLLASDPVIGGYSSIGPRYMLGSCHGHGSSLCENEEEP